jgi:hypothetical protein
MSALLVLKAYNLGFLLLMPGILSSPAAEIL